MARFSMRGLVAVITVGAVVVGGCSSDDGDDSEATTDTSAEVDSADETTSDDDDAQPEELTDEEFAGVMDELMESVDNAGTDLCAMVDAVNSASIPTDAPDTPAKVEQIVRVQADMLDAVAASEPVDAENATILRMAADEMRSMAADAGYTPEILDDEDFIAIQLAPDVAAALEAYRLRSESDC